MNASNQILFEAAKRHNIKTIPGAVLEFYQEGARWRAEIFGTPCRGCQFLQGGANQNISHIYFNFYLKEHLLNRLSLNCLWYDLIPTFLVFV